MGSEKLYDSELKLMELLWENEPISAKELSLLAAEKIGWNKNTTYTILNKLVAKKIIKREEPNFNCRTLVKKDEIRKTETNTLIDKLFDGSKQAFFASFIRSEELSEEDIEKIRSMIEKR